MSERFENKLILAPMVRASNLPLRLLALDYGADLVFTEELVDYRFLQCKRMINEKLGTVEYGTGIEDPIWQTLPSREKDRIIFQVGTNDADRALKVGKMVEQDIFAFDVNMGCPKSFSVQGGMGAALLTQPEKIREILTTLVNGLSVPVTCKIRLLPTLEESLDLCKMIQSCGVSAITIHGRTKDERPQHPNRNPQIAAISDALEIPVIANGGSGQIRSFEQIGEFRKQTNCSSVMLARSALKNVSIFSPHGKDSLDVVVPKYIKYCVQFGACAAHAKYVVQRMLGEEQQTTERGQQTLHACTLKEICVAWKMHHLVEEIKKTHKRKCEITSSGVETLDVFIPTKRLRRSPRSPKNCLNDWTTREEMQPPVYNTVRKGTDKRFHTTVECGGRSFASTQLQVNKKLSEQAAAFVAIHGLHLEHLLDGDWDDLFAIA